MCSFNVLLWSHGIFEIQRLEILNCKTSQCPTKKQKKNWNCRSRSDCLQSHNRLKWWLNDIIAEIPISVSVSLTGNEIMEKTRICYGASLGVVIKWSSLSEQKGLKQMFGLCVGVSHPFPWHCFCFHLYNAVLSTRIQLFRGPITLSI